MEDKTKKTISVDAEVHKELEDERLVEGETFNSIIKRLIENKKQKE